MYASWRLALCAAATPTTGESTKQVPQASDRCVRAPAPAPAPEPAAPACIRTSAHTRVNRYDDPPSQPRGWRVNNENTRGGHSALVTLHRAWSSGSLWPTNVPCSSTCGIGHHRDRIQGCYIRPPRSHGLTATHDADDPWQHRRGVPWYGCDGHVPHDTMQAAQLQHLPVTAPPCADASCREEPM